MKNERRRILFSGRVQGVGFRMTVLHLARDLTLSGTVQNLPDGGVELLAQGSAEEIEQLISRLREHFGSFIRTIQQDSLTLQANPGKGIQILH